MSSEIDSLRFKTNGENQTYSLHQMQDYLFPKRTCNPKVTGLSVFRSTAKSDQLSVGEIRNLVNSRSCHSQMNEPHMLAPGLRTRKRPCGRVAARCPNARPLPNGLAWPCVACLASLGLIVWLCTFFSLHKPTQTVIHMVSQVWQLYPPFNHGS